MKLYGLIIAGQVKQKVFRKNHNTIYVYCREKKHYIFNDLKEDYSKKSKHKSPRFSTIENGKINQTYVNGERKKSMRDVWDISYLNSQSKERIGYRTQKPEALLERIIQAFSNKHDTILDFMGGGATTSSVAYKLQRRFITGDVSPVAYRVMIDRLKRAWLSSKACQSAFHQSRMA